MVINLIKNTSLRHGLKYGMSRTFMFPYLKTLKDKKCVCVCVCFFKSKILNMQIFGTDASDLATDKYLRYSDNENNEKVKST